MRCIPYESYKELYINNINGIYYQWFKRHYDIDANRYIDTYQYQSFNDQPSERTSVSLFWESKNDFHRLYNKPAYYRIDSMELEFYIDGREIEIKTISKIHRDYRNR